MFKYLMLCVSLVLALPSYAAENIFDGGTTQVNCVRGDRAYIQRYDPLDNSVVKTGEMNLGVKNIQLSAAFDDPGLTGLEAVGERFDCDRLVGFKRGLLDVDLYPGMQQIGTLKITRSWYAGEYFDIGNGLAMKVIAGDNQGVQASPNAGNPNLETYRSSNVKHKSIGLAIRATLKVVGRVELGQRRVQIGTFEYRLIDNENRFQVAYAPVFFDIQVTQAKLRSCTLVNQGSEFYLSAVQRSDVFVRGTEIAGGNIIIGPVECDKGVDVKVSFFDHHGTEGLSDHLRTVYSDTLEPSQYALKFYPSTGGGQPLKFLPLSQFQGGTNSVENDTTINFAKSIADRSFFQKSYRVNYVRLGTVGDDRSGRIKGIMTVEFLYF